MSLCARTAARPTGRAARDRPQAGFFRHDATCTQDGYQRYMCTQCDYWYEKKTPALGHDWSDWEVDLEATSRTDGIKHRTCMRCGEVETYAIPSDHHKHTTVEHVVQPTCTEQGYTELRCVNSAGLPCGKTYIVQAARPRRSAMTTAATAASARSWSRPAPRAA